MRLSGKLTLTLIALCLVTILVSCAIIHQRALHVLDELAVRKLRAIRVARADLLVSHLEFLHKNSRIFAKSHNVAEAAVGFVKGFDSLRNRPLTVDEEKIYSERLATRSQQRASEATERHGPLEFVDPQNHAARYLQLHYAVEHPQPPAARPRERAASDQTDYAAAHAKFHPGFDEYRNELGIVDILIVHPETEEIVYTARNGLDLGADLSDGPFAETELAAAVRRIRQKKKNGAVEYVDFERWPGAGEAHSMCLVTGVFRENVMRGILVLRIPGSIFEQVLRGIPIGTEPVLGHSGEVMLVGRDAFIRSDRRHAHRNDPASMAPKPAGNTEPPAAGPQASLAANGPLDDRHDLFSKASEETEGTFRGEGPAGRPIVASYGKIDFGGLAWGLVASVDQREVDATISDFHGEGIASLAFAVGLAGAVSFCAGRSLTRPLQQAAMATRAFANGFFEVRLPVSSQDEFAELASSFNVMASEIESKTDRLKSMIGEHELLMEQMMPPLVQARFHRRDSLPSGSDTTLAFVEIRGLDDIYDRFAPAAALKLFDELLQSFDDASNRLGTEKLGQVGSGYMVGCGLGAPKFDHTSRVLIVARELQCIVDAFNASHMTAVHLGIGIHRGPISSGRLGRHEFVNSLWKRTIELAREIDPAAKKSCVRVSHAAFERVEGNPEFLFADNEIGRGSSSRTLLNFTGNSHVEF